MADRDELGRLQRNSAHRRASTSSMADGSAPFAALTLPRWRKRIPPPAEPASAFRNAGESQPFEVTADLLRLVQVEEFRAREAQ